MPVRWVDQPSLNKLAFWGAGVSTASKENVNRPMGKRQAGQGSGPMDRAGWGMEQGEVFTLSEAGNREPWKVSARGWVRLGSPARQPWECSEQGMSWHWHPRCCPYCARPVHEEGTGRATQVHLSSCYKQAELCLRKEREAKNIYEQQKKEKKRRRREITTEMEQLKPWNGNTISSLNSALAN